MKSTERKLSVRPETKRKFVRAAAEMGWTHAETAERAADALLEKEGLSTTSPVGTRSSAGQGTGKKKPRRSAA